MLWIVFPLNVRLYKKWWMSDTVLEDCVFIFFKLGVLIQTCETYQAIHGTLKTVEGPPNLGANLPLSTKPTHSNSSNSSSLVNYKKESENDEVKGQNKHSPPPLKKTKPSGDLKGPPGSGYTCGQCSNVFNSREAFVAHMRREHSKVNVCTGCVYSIKKQWCCINMD